jgi:putative spermidine/putrescine transport system ATP-binding protein
MLSLEERQRVALARALVFRPKLLLLDEPLGRLGGTAREAFARDLRRLHDRLGLTILYATREAVEALALSDRITVLRQGRIRQIDPPSRLYAEPADAFVARIAGQNNLLPGVIENCDEDEVEVRLDAGPKVSARPVHAFQTGDPCVVAIRPERIALVRAEAADMGDDALPARLEQVVFLGADLCVRLRVAWQRGQWAGMDARAAAEMIVRRPAGMGVAGLAPGDTAALAWRPTDALAFQPESSIN